MSRSSSRSSSAESNPRAPASPVPAQNVERQAALQLDAPDDSTQLFLLLLSGSVGAVNDLCQTLGTARCVEYCTQEREHEGEKGNLFYFGAFYNKRPILRALVEACGGPNNDSIVRCVVPLLQRFLSVGRFPVVLFLCALCPKASLEVIDVARGDLLLHAVCRLERPPLWFVNELLAHYCSLLPPKAGANNNTTHHHHHTTNSFDATRGSQPRSHSRGSGGGASHRNASSSTSIHSGGAKPRKLPHINTKNKKGKTPLHLAAIHLAGAGGRDIAKALVHHGADETIPPPEHPSRGPATLAELCNNGYIRQYLAILESHHRGRIPTIDPSTKEVIDGCETSESFPVLKEIKEEDIKLPPSGKEQQTADGGENDEGETEGRKKGAPLSQEEQDALVDRLFAQSTRAKQKWLESEYQKLHEEDMKRYHSKQLAADEVESSVARVFQEAAEKHMEKMTELNGKYIRERTPGPTLEREDLEACCQRLCGGSLEKLAANRESLTAKYSPKVEHKKLSKEEETNCGQRLCHQSQEKTKAEIAKLYDKYCSPPRLCFNGEERPPLVLTADQIKVVADRLSTKK